MTNKKPSGFGRQEVELIEQATGYRGFFSLLRVTLKHKLFAGGWSEPITRELFERGNAAAVLPYDPIRDEVILIEQFRVGAYQAEQPWLFEVVAGIVEAGENPEQVVRREAQEEAGITLGAIVQASHYYSSPGGCSEQITVFIGEVDASTGADIAGLAAENEDIKVHRMPRVQAMQWLQEGKINNATTIIALQWLALKRTQVDDEKAIFKSL